MEEHNTASTFDANFKKVYGDKGIDDLIPKNTQLQRKIPFETGKKVGDHYEVPAALTREHGVTYLGSNYGVEAMKAAVAAVYKSAQVDPSGMILRSSLSYSVLDRTAGDAAAFKNATKAVVRNMVESIRDRLETDILYGRQPLGVVASATDSTADVTITITDATWATGIWNGAENATVDIWDTTLATNRTNDATTAAYVKSVDPANKQIVVTCADATDAGNVAAGDKIFFDGAYAGSSTWKCMAGIKQILTATSSIFNINPSTYNLWKGNEYGVGSANLTLSKILQGVSTAVGKGLDSDLDVIVSPATFATMGNDEAALRRHGGKVGKTENGVEALCFYFGDVKMDIWQHRKVQEGDAFALPMKRMKRIGATDVTFKLEGMQDRVFLNLPDETGYELRCRTEQCIFLETPAQATYFSGIVN